MRPNKLSKIDMTSLLDKPWYDSQRPVLQAEGMKLEFSGFGLLYVMHITFRGIVSGRRWCSNISIDLGRRQSINPYDKASEK